LTSLDANNGAFVGQWAIDADMSMGANNLFRGQGLLLVSMAYTEYFIIALADSVNELFFIKGDIGEMGWVRITRLQGQTI